MIIEVCGLPASGKSTFVKKLYKVLTDADLSVEIKPSPLFYHNFNSRVNVLRGIMLCFTNFVRAPIISSVILGEIVKHDTLLSKRMYLKLYISMQYHINWINFKKKLIEESDGQRIILIDGSPWNIVSDIPKYDVGKLMKRLRPCYSEATSNLIIISQADIQKCLDLMKVRGNQPLEPLLYGKLEDLESIEKTFQLLPATFAEQGKLNPQVGTFNLFTEDAINYCKEAAHNYI